MHRSACLVARKADLRGSGWQGRHAALVVQCAVGVVLHPRCKEAPLRDPNASDVAHARPGKVDGYVQEVYDQ